MKNLAIFAIIALAMIVGCADDTPTSPAADKAGAVTTVGASFLINGAIVAVEVTGDTEAESFAVMALVNKALTPLTMLRADKADPDLDQQESCGFACAPQTYCELEKGHGGPHRCQ